MPQLDHLVILLPHAYLGEETPAWLSDNFTIIPGGRHGDGKTENKLIVLDDGSYMELIAFIQDDPERRAGHYWDKPYGAVDFALTTAGSGQDVASEAGTVHSSITERLASLEGSHSTCHHAASQPVFKHLSYSKPVHGGRTNQSGEQIEWQVTFPTGVGRGEVPSVTTLLPGADECLCRKAQSVILAVRLALVASSSLCRRANCKLSQKCMRQCVV